MLLVDLKPLFARLNGYTTQALESAAGLCLQRTHYEIGLEHYLLRLMDDAQADVGRILAHFEIDAARLQQQLETTLGELKTGNSSRPTFSPLLTEWIQDAWLSGSVTLGERRIRSGALLLALVTRRNYYTSSGAWGELLSGVSREKLGADFDNIVAGSPESRFEKAEAGDEAGAGEAPGTRGEEAIDRFCEDFTAKAAKGLIDPVFGRDAEIRQMVDVLARRRKNNPICVGDPGVGKTAVVEGLALRIADGDVPEFLRSTRLLGLDLGALEAGASVKGEFEKRLKAVIDEVKASPRSIILFIDEAHMLVGAGGQAGGSDAANLLKPALARGELRTIAATTWTEYKKYFEKDPALARRFQLVKLDEPDAATAAQILRGLKSRYEEVHGVEVRDDAIVAAAELADRYITGRLLPDKAVDLLDTAAARVKISLDAKPAVLEDKERQIAALEREQAALERDRRGGYPYDAERLADIAETCKSLAVERDALTQRWRAEQAAARQVLERRRARAEAEAAAAQAEPVAGPEATAEPEVTSELEATSEPETTDTETADGEDGETLVFTEVNPDAVAKVVSDWTGVPVGKVLRDEAATVMTLADNLKARIRGQDHALNEISDILRAAKSGLRDPAQPMGVFLLVGPSGVGKTESALAVADLLMGGEHALVSINMSEFQEKHTVSRLVGSPPGYVGYGEGGVLTEAVRQRPYSVVLLDEVEKAHLDVMNLFYQVFDKGVLSDGEGREVDFSNTVIFLTSNLATDEITAACAQGGVDPKALAESIRPILARHFKPALLARMTVVPYFTLAAGALADIVRLKLDRVAQRLQRTNRVRLEVDDAVVDTIAARCTEVDTGARNIDFILRQSLMPRLSDELLAAMAAGRQLAYLRLGVDEQGDWAIGTGQ